MKKTIILAACALALAACKMDLPLYDYAGDGLTFAQTEIEYSFVYAPDDNPRQSVTVDLNVLGFMPDRDRPVRFEQIASDNPDDDARAGVHYVAFDDRSLAEQYVVPAGATSVTLPVVLLRDPSLDTKDYTLRFRVADNGHFTSGLKGGRECTIVITGRLVEPPNWPGDIGVYSAAKHLWLIEQTGHKWDSDFISTTLGWSDGGATNANYDPGYWRYYVGWLREMLAEWEAENGRSAGFTLSNY
jgi:hypothetical protein